MRQRSEAFHATGEKTNKPCAEGAYLKGFSGLTKRQPIDVTSRAPDRADGRKRGPSSIGASGAGAAGHSAASNNCHLTPPSGCSQSLFREMVAQRRGAFRRMNEDGHSLEEIGRWYGISRQAVSATMRRGYVDGKEA